MKNFLEVPHSYLGPTAMGQITTIQIGQLSKDDVYDFVVFIDEIEVHRVRHNDPQEYINANIRIYASDDLVTAGHARIRNLDHQTYQESKFQMTL